jgi:hypothetical protein
MTCKNENKTNNMQFLQLFSILVLLLVHFDCSQATLTRSSSLEDPLRPGYKRQVAKLHMKAGVKSGAMVGVAAGTGAGFLSPLPFFAAIACVPAGAVAGAGVGAAVGAAVGTVKACREQKKAKKAIAAITGKQQSNKPTGHAQQKESG